MVHAFIDPEIKKPNYPRRTLICLPTKTAKLSGHYTLKIILRYLEKKMKTQGKFKKDDCITKAQVLLVLEGTCLTGRD